MTHNAFAVTVFRSATGEVVSSTRHTSDGDEDFKALVIANILAAWGDGHGVTEGDANPIDEHYVQFLDETAIVVRKPDLIVHVEDEKTTIEAGGEDFTTLTGLPDPCTIIIDDPDPGVATQEIDVAGGGFIFEADDPGVYTIEIRRFPFLPYKIEITAT